MINQTITIVNKLGLHARAAAKFVSHTTRFASEIEVKKNDQVVNGKSIMGVMMLAAAKGSQLELMITGDDEQAMADDIVALINSKFGEDE